MKQKTLAEKFRDAIDENIKLGCSDIIYGQSNAADACAEIAEQWADKIILRESKLIEKRIRESLAEGFMKLLDESCGGWNSTK